MSHKMISSEELASPNEFRKHAGNVKIKVENTIVPLLLGLNKSKQTTTDTAIADFRRVLEDEIIAPLISQTAADIVTGLKKKGTFQVPDSELTDIAEQYIKAMWKAISTPQTMSGHDFYDRFNDELFGFIFSARTQRESELVSEVLNKCYESARKAAGIEEEQ